MSKVTTPGGTRSSQEPNIYNKFQSDKKSTLSAIEEFLQSTPESLTITQKDLETYQASSKACNPRKFHRSITTT